MLKIYAPITLHVQSAIYAFSSCWVYKLFYAIRILVNQTVTPNFPTHQIEMQHTMTIVKIRDIVKDRSDICFTPPSLATSISIVSIFDSIFLPYTDALGMHVYKSSWGTLFFSSRNITVSFLVITYTCCYLCDTPHIKPVIYKEKFTAGNSLQSDKWPIVITSSIFNAMFQSNVMR